MLILTNMLRTLDANCVSYSPTRAQFVMITGLLNIELLGLQDGYPGGETMNVNSEWQAAREESLVGGQGDIFRLGGPLAFSINYIHTKHYTAFYIGISSKPLPTPVKQSP
jgi:hypothetical protein